MCDLEPFSEIRSQLYNIIISLLEKLSVAIVWQDWQKHVHMHIYKRMYIGALDRASTTETQWHLL